MRLPWRRAQAQTPAKPMPRWKREIVEWTKSLGIGLLFVFFFTELFFKAYKVDGISMQPTLQNGERLFVNRYVYHTDPLPFLGWELPATREPARGDIVVFWFPRNPHQYFIKRVIAVPGDRIELREGQIFINGEQRDDSYIPLRYRNYRNIPATTVPIGYYYVVGDHRNRSYDSRDWGFVPRKYIIGQAALRYWPIGEFGLIPEIPEPAVAP